MSTGRGSSCKLQRSNRDWSRKLIRQLPSTFANSTAFPDFPSIELSRQLGLSS